MAQCPISSCQVQPVIYTNEAEEAIHSGDSRVHPFAAFEMEYRFPVTSDKLFSGVIYFNMQTASDDKDLKVFERWAPAGGIGVRILFNKHSRTNLSLDFAKGRYGSLGLFSGLNEVF